MVVYHQEQSLRTAQHGGMAEIGYPPDWTTRAKCLDQPWDYAPGESGFERRLERDAEGAAARCEGCPVKAECLAQAMRDEKGKPARLRAGIWGGLTPKQRVTLELANEECAAGHKGRIRIYTSTRGRTVSCLECRKIAQRERDKEITERRRAKLLSEGCGTHGPEHVKEDSRGVLACFECRRIALAEGNKRRREERRTARRRKMKEAS